MKIILSKTIKVRSYAKVNYTLDVMSPRSDGYHSIASVMQTISMYDTISISISDRPEILFECNSPHIPSDASNLAYRAADALLKDCQCETGLTIKLDKVIPSQAGLGGGSSNAAYTLLGVNRLMNLNVEFDRLSAIASSLGSDVPFFLKGGTAVARGRGELIYGIPDSPKLYFVIVKPESNVATAAGYLALDAIPERQSHRNTTKMEKSILEADIDRIISRMSNDFEAAILPADPLINALADDFMMARAENVRLCGSGAAMFGLCRNEMQASETARLMRLKYPNVFVCETVNQRDALIYDFEETI